MPRKPFVLIALVFMGIALPSRAAAQDPFDEFLRREADQLRQFLSREDQQFADFLKREWRDFEMFVTNKPIDRKPVAQPTAPPSRLEAGPPPAPTPVGTRPPGAEPGRPVAGPTVRPIPDRGALPSGALPPAGATGRSPWVPSGGNRVTLAGMPSAGMRATPFYGGAVMAPNADLKLRRLQTVNRDAISAFWVQMNAAPYQDVLAALQRQRDVMRLGDMGFAQLAFRKGLTLTDGDSTLSTLVAWHFMLKSGYRVRLAFQERTVLLLLNTNEIVYDTPYFQTGHGRFYSVNLAGGRAPRLQSVSSYDQDYPTATKAVSYHMEHVPLLPEALEDRTFRFTYRGTSYAFTVPINRNTMDYLARYPQHELSGYLNARIESTALDSLVGQLRRVIAGMPEAEAVNLIMRFVQTAFQYKTDDQQFGYEKWNFPEETLFYPYSDCEDRSILFAHLVRRLTSVQVVAILWPEHVATALRSPNLPSGDLLVHEGVQYLFADPTYINSDIGMAMPQFKGVAPKAVYPARPIERDRTRGRPRATPERGGGAGGAAAPFACGMQMP